MSSRKRKPDTTQKSVSFQITSQGIREETTGNLYDTIRIRKPKQPSDPHPDRCVSYECDQYESEVYKVQYKWKGATIEYNTKHCKTGKIPTVVSPLLCGMLSTEHIKVFDKDTKTYIQDRHTAWTSTERCLCSKGCALAMSMISAMIPARQIHIHKIRQDNDHINSLFPSVSSLVTPQEMDQFVQISNY